MQLGKSGMAILYVFSSAGALIPLFWMAFWQVVRFADLQSIVGLQLYKFQLMLWPTSIFMMGTAEGRLTGLSFWKVFFLSVAANVVIYSVVGFLIHLGWTRFTLLLYIVPALILMAWSFLFI
jgi:hypothetical protein